VPFRKLRSLLVELALLMCPVDFRREYADSIRKDVNREEPLLGAAVDILFAGILEHLDAIVRLVKDAIRSLIREPLLSGVAVLTLTLALGLNLAVATILHDVLLARLPYENSQQLFFVQETERGHSLSYPDAQRLASVLDPGESLSLAAFDTQTLLKQGRATALSGARVSENYFDNLGVRPRFGRSFGAARISSLEIIISSSLWERYFGADTGVLGKTVHLGNRAYTVVGVAPDGFIDPTPYGLQYRDYWVPISTDEMTRTGDFNFNGIVRARSDGNTGAVRHRLKSALASLASANHNIDREAFSPEAFWLQDAIVGPAKPLLLALFIVVTTVLLIACANVTNLQLARNATRENALALRSALGASRMRIATQLGTEMALLASIGTLLGLGLSWLVLQLLSGVGSQMLPRWSNVGINGWTFAYAAGLLCVTILLAGILPALTPAPTLITSGTTYDRRFAKQVRGTLVIVEIALTLSLVLSAALVVRSMLAYTHIDLGFDASNLYQLRLNLPEQRNNGAQRRLAFLSAATSEILRIGGVESAAAALQAPLACCSSTSFAQPKNPTRQTPTLYNTVTPGYFQTLGIHVLSGRGFTASDRAGSACVAIVDERFADKYLRGSARGARVVPAVARNPVCSVVGVVQSVRENFGSLPEPMLYLSANQFPEAQTIIVRLRHRSSDLAKQTDAAFGRIDPNLPAPPVASYTSLIERETVGARVISGLFSALAVIALLLTLSGIYSITSYSVERRWHEFGIRKALGASSQEILVDVLSKALGQAAIGIAFGILASMLFAQMIAKMLYTVSPFDVASYAATVALCVASTIVAALVPALKAVRTDPAVALRHE
jgi:putative ABC transport system permease protein